MVTKHRADLPVLCGCFPLAIYFTFGSVYMSMPLSHFVPASPSPSPCPQVHSLPLCLYSCPAPRFFRTMFSFFRFHTYALAYGMCCSFWLTPPRMTVSGSTHLTTRTWKPPERPSTDEWIKKMWPMYTVDYYSAVHINLWRDIIDFSCPSARCLLYSQSRLLFVPPQLLA